MLALGRLLATSTTSRVTCQLAAKRFASTTIHNNTNILPIFNYTPLKNNTNISVASVSEHISRLRPFSAPPAPQTITITTPVNKATIEELELTSVLRKRRLKMNKHKHKKLRKRTRALRKKLGK